MTARFLSPVLVLLAGCGATYEVEVRISGQERVVSEDGELELLSGCLGVVSATLHAQDGSDWRWLEDQSVDLGAPMSTVDALTPGMAGTWTDWTVELGPAGRCPGAISATVQGEDRPPLEVLHTATFSRESVLLAPLEVAADARMTLTGELAILLFYVRPYGLAEDGVFLGDADPMDQGFLENNLAGLLRLGTL